MSHPVRAMQTARFLCAVALAAAILVLAGWTTRYSALRSFGQPWTPVVVSTALSCAIAAVAIMLNARTGRSARGIMVAGVGGVALAVHSFAVLANATGEWMRGAPWVATGPALRMAPTTAAGFALLGATLVALSRGRARAAEVFAAVAAFVSGTMLLAFGLGAAPVSDLMGRVNMSPLTGLILGLLAISAILVTPDGWFIGVMTGVGAGSQIARRLLLIALSIPLVVGILSLEAERHGFFSRAYSSAVTIIASILLVVGTVLWAAQRANTSEISLRRELDARRAAEDAQRRAYDRYRLLFDSSPLPKWMVAVDTMRFLTVNQAAVDAYGYSVDEFLGLRMADLIVSDDTEVDMQAMASESSRLRLPMRHRRKDGSILDVEVTATVLDVEGQRVRLSVINDVTARVRAERELREMAADLEERVTMRTAQLKVANRELEAFSYSVSHDLRTPLRALDGFSQALLEDYSDRLDDTGRDYLRRIRSGSQRMGELIDALLDLSRVSRDTLRFAPVDLSAAAREIVGTLRERSPGRSVDARIAHGLTTTGDPRLLRALLENLLANAWKFTAGRPEATIEFSADGDNGERRFRVQDNGVGFDMAHANKLFGAFQRLHDAHQFAGTGIGLATAQRIVHRHGGRIWAEAAPDRGATFYFTLGPDNK